MVNSRKKVRLYQERKLEHDQAATDDGSKAYSSVDSIGYCDVFH